MSEGEVFSLNFLKEVKKYSILNSFSEIERVQIIREALAYIANEKIENIPSNEELLQIAADTREDFYATTSQVLDSIPKPPEGWRYRGTKR